MSIWDCRLYRTVRNWLNPSFSDLPKVRVEKIHDFYTGYANYKRNLIKSFFSKRLDGHSSVHFFNGYFSKDGSKKGPFAYIDESFSLVIKNNRRFTITTLGINDSETFCPNLSKIENFPTSKDAINSYVVLISEVSDDWDMTGKGLAMGFGERERVQVGEFHGLVTQMVENIAGESGSIDDVIRDIEESQYGDFVIKRYDF